MPDRSKVITHTARYGQHLQVEGWDETDRQPHLVKTFMQRKHKKMPTMGPISRSRCGCKEKKGLVGEWRRLLRETTAQKGL
jgi:hypothetical protein